MKISFPIVYRLIKLQFRRGYFQQLVSGKSTAAYKAYMHADSSLKLSSFMKLGTNELHGSQLQSLIHCMFLLVSLVQAGSKI